MQAKCSCYLPSLWEKRNANYQKYSMRIQLLEAFQIYISRMETQKVLKIEILLSFNK